MTPPRACVEALTSAAANGDLWVHAGNRDDILHAVIAAFVAGEVSGRWAAVPHVTGGSWWTVTCDGISEDLALGEAQARAVANVLNYLEAQRG